MSALSPVVPRVGERSVPLVLAVATVLAQIAYPLTPLGPPRDRLTVATVMLFCAASVSHALVWRGLRFTVLLVTVTAGGGLLVEAVGVATGFPFGSYAYTGSLGWQLLGVPIVIPLAWTMMGYSALVVGQRIAGRWWLEPLAAGAALASWDLFLDPQMVDAGHWAWAGGSGPEVVGIPVLNFVAWLVVATTMMAIILIPAPWNHAAARLPHRVERVHADQARLGTPAHAGLVSVRRDDRVPYALYLWTYASSVMAHLVFFGLPGSALLGGVGMGVVVVLFLRASRRR